MKTGMDDGNAKRFNAKIEEVVPPRRIVLRNALAVGCGLMLPAILMACDSKKDAGSKGTAPADATDTGADTAAAAASGKVTQASVQYQAQPKGVQQCSGCTHFIAESNTCKLVEGQISPDGWCLLWAQKA